MDRIRGVVLAGTLLMSPCVQAQALTEPAPAYSVVARLVAARAVSPGPVSLASLTAFAWDEFGVVAQAAGEPLVQCTHAGFMPCDPGPEPARGQAVQVLVFHAAGNPVYRERILASHGVFAEPLPQHVPPAAAILVSCTGLRGEPLWCLRGTGRGRIADPFLDGG